MAEFVYGIDFGTSNSSIMIAYRGGALARVKDPASPRGATAIPSTICVKPDGELLVGAAAEAMKLSYPENYRREFKRDFGSPQPSVLGGQSMRPYQMASHVLRFLRRLAEGVQAGRPDRVVITVPVAWEDGNRDLMLDAAENAGLPRSRITLVSEPVAAAVNALEKAPKSVKTLLVYDLGGGTFDCAVVRRMGDGYEVLGAPGGVDTVGGAEFDRLILGRVRETFPEQAARLLNGSAADGAVLRRRLELRDACEAIKIKLSLLQDYQDFLPMLGDGLTFSLSQKELGKLVEPLVEETLAECERVLSAQGLSVSDIDRIAPVGGSSKLPIIHDMLSRWAGDSEAVLTIGQPADAVVRGAVRMAHAEAYPPPPPPKPAVKVVKPVVTTPATPTTTTTPAAPSGSTTPTSSYTPSSQPPSSSSSGTDLGAVLFGAGVGAVLGALIGVLFFGVGAVPGLIIGAVIGGWRAYNE
jgi:molecular chaperone DnaK (HSP70)